MSEEDEHRKFLRNIWDELRDIQIGRISLEEKSMNSWVASRGEPKESWMSSV